MNLEQVQAKAQQLQQPNSQQDPEGIDAYADYLVRFIQDLIGQAVPLARPSE